MCCSHPLIGGQCLLHLALGAMMFEYPRGLQDKCHKVFCAIELNGVIIMKVYCYMINVLK